MLRSSPPLHSHLYRCRIAASALLAVSSLALFLIGIGLYDPLPLPKTVAAESAPSDMHGVPPAVLPESVVMRLQAAVDSAALSLGGVFREAASAKDGPVVYSPLAPDAVDMDFADALDQRGSAFVLCMKEVPTHFPPFSGSIPERYRFPRRTLADLP